MKKLNKIMSHEFYSYWIELKNKVILCAFFYVIMTIISYFFIDQIMFILIKPLKINDPNLNLVYTSLPELFLTKIGLSFYAGLFFSMPVILILFYSFMAPALYKDEKNIFKIYMLLVPILFILGSFLAYYYVIPMAWQFFSSMQFSEVNNNFTLLPKISDYFELTKSFIIAFGLCFQIPVIVSLLVRFQILTVQKLSSLRKYIIVLIFCLSAILTPPDILSQIGLAIPMLILFEMSMLWCSLIEKGREND